MKTEIERIQELLPTELFVGSKDWREGNTVERIEWLLSMYASAKKEVARLEDILENANADRYRE
jgi:polyphosphate kinase